MKTTRTRRSGRAPEASVPKGVRKRATVGRATRRALKDRGISIDRKAADVLVQRFVVVEPPADAPLTTIGFATVYEGGDGGGKSTKLGNVRLKLKTFMTAVSGGVITVAGLSAPWMFPFGAWLLFESLLEAVRVDLGETEAAVLWALWQTRDKRTQHTVAKREIVTTVNRELRQVDRPALTAAQIRDALAKLRDLACIGESRTEPDRYTLREWVEVKYR
jgi:hypothetical protein